MGISTHILDTSRGRPAAGVPVTLEIERLEEWEVVSLGKTDADGRIRLTESVEAATYRLIFDIGDYFAGAGFFPLATITFRITEPSQHYHVPLLLSPFGYSTYRGS
jgi:5-hydroxyisourate hydrolase